MSRRASAAVAAQDRDRAQPGSASRVADGDRRRNSASAVLRAILERGPVARSTVARLTGLSPASVTDHCAGLARLGLIEEAPAPLRANGIGRPHVPVDLTGPRLLAGGIHVAVPHTTVALLDLRGRVVAQRRIPHSERERRGDGPGPAAMLRRAAGELSGLMSEQADEARALGIGVALGGVVDPQRGMVVEHALLGWRDVPARELVEDATGLPVHVDGHGRGLLHAERLFGRHAHSPGSMLHLFVGNMVDAGFATAGRVHYGPRSQAGTIAHLPVHGGTEPCLCGRSGCLQAEVSERTLCRRALEAGVIAEPDPLRVVAAAEEGRPAAVRLLLDRSRLVGRAVGLLLDILDPDTVVVTEVGAVYREDCLAALRAEAAAHATARVDATRRVVPTSFPGTATAMAGGAVALDVVYRDPFSAQLRGVNSESRNDDRRAGGRVDSSP